MDSIYVSMGRLAGFNKLVKSVVIHCQKQGFSNKCTESTTNCVQQGDHVKVPWGQLSSRGFLRRLLPHFPPTKKKSFIVKNKDLVINAQNPYGSNASYPRPLPSGVHMPKQHSLSGYTSCA